MVAEAHLDSVELGIPNPQVGVGDVPPSAANVNRLVGFRGYPNSAAAPRGEVEVRSVSRGEVGVGTYGTSGQFDVRRGASGVQARVPAQNNGFKTSAVYGLWLKLPKQRDDIGSVFEAPAPPTAADFAGQHFADEKPRRQNLRF